MKDTKTVNLMYHYTPGTGKEDIYDANIKKTGNVIDLTPEDQDNNMALKLNDVMV